MRWLKSVAAKSCDNSIASKSRWLGLPARSWRTRTRPHVGTQLTRCALMLLASASFWTASWTGTRPTLAMALSLIWNGMPSMACRHSFARCARSWKASRLITSQRSTWCRCLSLCSWSTTTTASSNCKRSTVSWRWSKWRWSSRNTRASWCRN